MLGLAMLAALPAAGVAWGTRSLPHEVAGVLTVALYAAFYFAGAKLAGVREADPWLALFSRANRRDA